MRYHPNGLAVIDAKTREDAQERIRSADRIASRNRDGWNRLCGIAPMIGGPSAR
jgi:hypothetical protein